MVESECFYTNRFDEEWKVVKNTHRVGQKGRDQG